MKARAAAWLVILAIAAVSLGLAIAFEDWFSSDFLDWWEGREGRHQQGAQR